MAEPTASVYPAYGTGAPSGDFYVLGAQPTYGPYDQGGTTTEDFTFSAQGDDDLSFTATAS